MNQAAAWAIRRVGGHLRVDPARAVRSAPWDEEEAEALIDDARRWSRVGGDGVIEADEFLARLVGGVLGAHLDGIGGRMELWPALPGGWKHLVVRRLRANRTLLDLEVKARAEWLTVKLAVRFGPPVPMLVGSLDQTVARLTVDEISMVGPRAIFTAEGEHEVTLYYGV